MKYALQTLPYWLKNKEKLDWIAERLQIQTQDAWYQVTKRELKLVGAKRFLDAQYNGSLEAALQDCYKEFDWNPLLFNFLSKNRWLKKSNRRKMMDWISEQLGVQVQQDWYSITTGEVLSAGAGSLLVNHYKCSLVALLQGVYPEFEWNPHRFTTVPRKYWQHKENHRKVLDWIGEQLNIKTQEDWYSILPKQVKEIGLHRMLREHEKTSLVNALRVGYSEFTWNPLRFAAPPRRYLDTVDSKILQESVDESLESVISEPTSTKWKKLYSSPIFTRIARKFGRVQTLEKFYPDINWEVKQARGSLGETFLERMLKQIAIVNRDAYIEGHSVDIYLPQVSLALEFQGIQHYKQIHTGTLEEQQERDYKKREALKQLGITLVEVPYWWNKNFATLLSTIHKRNPTVM